ncbi:NAD(P)-binding protein [Teratosphaeria nubilosa]|uniref:NAD(P)-binding protein n=1 Tax=Teratosphaeria nubilosa TaxID=161662 RepID=A0A6G1LAN7_9PEZI|nr:NAD(P)-binding protein [Teratosphaeria nubilosa]
MSKSTILITGATGHLGSRTLITALEHGYKCRILLRDLTKAEKIRKLASVQPFLDDMQFVEVQDITRQDASNEAIQGVDYVLHIASPIFDPSGASSGPQDWLKGLCDPAVKGTLSVLRAASETKSVKRVVITSSIVILEPKQGSNLASPYDLAPVPSEESIKAMNQAQAAYTASKILAYQAATNFMREERHFDIVHVMPGYIQGANELATSPSDILRGSAEGTLNIALGNVVDHVKPGPQVLVDDIARTHVLALNADRVRSGTNLVAVGNGGYGWTWDDFVPVIKKAFPRQVEDGTLQPKEGQAIAVLNCDSRDTEKLLGFEFAGPEEMVKSVVCQYLRLIEL